MEVTFNVTRQDHNGEPRVENYTLDVQPGNTILDCLNRIKWELDGSLAFRKNCRNTICGSCTIKINGRSALACKENIGAELNRLQQTDPNSPLEIKIAPMGNLPVIKDLVVEMKAFWDNLEKVEPYVSTKGRIIPEREFLQTPEEREKLNETGNCILCGACYSECNAADVNPNFLGPHALAKAQRILSDSRDNHTEVRLENYHNTDGVWGCTRCFMCNTVCPMEVNPMDQISKIKGELLQRKDESDSTMIRHRKVLVNLVKEGGWIDERKFGVFVVANYLRNVKGLLSVLPLGFRMLSHGKFPVSFEPSEGTDQVRSLIESVQQETSNR